MSMSEECDARDEHLPDRVEGWVNVYDAPTSGDLSLILYKTPLTQWKPSYCVLRIKRHRLLHFTSEKDAEVPRKCRMAVVLKIGGTKEELNGEGGSSVNISKSKSVQDQWTKAASKSPSAYNERKCSSTSSAKDNGIVKSQLGDRRTSVPSIISYPSTVEDSTDSPSAPNRLMNYISRKSSQIKSNFNLKRTRSSTKLDRKKPEIVVTNGGPEKESSLSFSSALKRTMSLSRLSRRFHGRARTAQETESTEQRPLRTAHSHESLLPAQASVPTTNFYLGSVDIKLIHGSILGKENCFQVSSSLGTKYYSCRTPSERQTWISQLRRTIQPVQDQFRRHERSLALCISEAKNVASKQRYYCEFSLDGTVYGRTSSKLKGDILLWSENFSFRNLQKFEKLSVNLYKDIDRKKKKETNVLIGCVVIPLADIMTRQMVEQWFPVQVSPIKNSKDQTGDIPGIRLKARYLCVDILPASCYQPLLEFVKQHYCHLVNELERLSVAVRAKDDLGCVLVNVLHSVGLAKDFIVGVLMDQVKRENDPKLLLRSNSIASKSIDAYMKLVGEKYLHETLKDFIKLVLDNQMSLDGSNTSSAAELQRKRDKLVEFCDIACYRIFNSLVHNHLPVELKHVFSALRKQLVVSGKDEDICRQLISSCFFLRFLSPAILNPNLFGLTQAFPEETDAHNLKLIAKTIMVLANFSRFGEGKEDSMVFLNSFIDKQTPNMKKFIDDISTCSEVTSSSMFECYVDAGRESAFLHLLLKENLFKQANETPTDDMKELQGILMDIDNALKTIPHLPNDRVSTNDGRFSYESGTPMFMSASENLSTHSASNIDQQTRFTSNTTVTLTTSTPTTPLNDLSGSSFFINNMPGTRRTMREMQDSDRYTSMTSLGVLPIRPPMTESSILFTNKPTESTNGTTQLLYAAETVDTDLTSEVMAFWEDYLHEVLKGEEPISPKNKPAPPSQTSANCWPPNGSIKRNPKRQPLAFANPLFVYGTKSENNLDKFKKSGSLSSVNSAKGGRTVSPSPSVDGVAMSSVPACRLSTNSEFSEIQNYMSNLSNSILSRSMDFPLPPPRNTPGGLKRTNTEGIIISQQEVMTTSINSPPESPSCSQSIGRRGLSNQGSVRMGIRSVQRKIVDNEKQYEVELRNLQHQLSATQALLQQEQSLRLEMEKDFQQKSRMLEGEYMQTLQRQVELEAEKRRLVERVEYLQSELERERSLRQQQDLKVETLTSSLGNMKFRHVSDIHAKDRNCNTH